MFIHSVYFWQRDDLSADEQRQFEDGLRSLTGIASVRHGYVGAPASTDRPIIDRSYSHALICVFDTPDDHDAYQVDPVHDAFRDTCAGFWKDIKIYDAVT